MLRAEGCLKGCVRMSDSSSQTSVLPFGQAISLWKWNLQIGTQTQEVNSDKIRMLSEEPCGCLPYSSPSHVTVLAPPAPREAPGQYLGPQRPTDQLLALNHEQILESQTVQERL